MTTSVEPSSGSTQPRRRSSLQFEKNQLEKLVNATVPNQGRQRGGSLESYPTRAAGPFETNEQRENVSTYQKFLPILLVAVALLGLAGYFFSNDERANTLSNQNFNTVPLTSRYSRSLVEDTSDIDGEEAYDDDLDDSGIGRDLKAKRKQKNVKSKLPIHGGDLRVWRKLLAETNGPKWLSCNNPNNPCDQGKQCAKSIQCKIFDGKRRIVAIRLPNNRLKGRIPGLELDDMDELKVFDVSNAPSRTKNMNNLKPALPCFPFNRCITDDSLECDFANTGMENTPIDTDPAVDPNERIREIHYCLPTAFAIEQGDLEAWQDLYNATNGSSWVACSEAYNDPCSCMEDDIYVMCEWFPGNVLRIAGLSLRGNNLKGRLSPSLALLTELSLLDLTANPELTGCVGIEQCTPGTANQASCTMDAPVTLCNGKGSGGTIPDTSDPFRLDPRDLAVWQTVHDDLNGDFWQRCSNSFNNPCAAPECVKCALASSGKNRIVAINLTDNGMTGVLPIAALASLAPSLLTVDVSTTDPLNTQTRNIFTNNFTTCVVLPSTLSWNVVNSGLHVCDPATPDGRRLDSLESADNVLLPSDLAAFQAFYRALQGREWRACRNTFENPCGGCDVEEEVDVSSAVVTCSKVGPFLRISEISMRSQHLQGVLPIEALNSLDRLAILDLSNQPLANKDDWNHISSKSSNGKCVEGLNICSRAETFCTLRGTGLAVGIECDEEAYAVDV